MSRGYQRPPGPERGHWYQASYRGHSKDGKELRDGPKYRYVFGDPDVVTLVVSDGVLVDLGQYSINVTNHFGQCSDLARILVEVPAKIQKGPNDTKAHKGTTVTLTAEILGAPAPEVGWTKDGEDIEEDDRRRCGPAARIAPGARAWAAQGPETQEWDGGRKMGGEEQSWLISPAQVARKLIRGPAIPLFPARVFFGISSTTTTLTSRRATPEDSGKYEVYVENSLSMDQSFGLVDVARKWPSYTSPWLQALGSLGPTTLLHIA
ncbi:CAVP-target protein [Camelus dromedarius]|uniref:CAVP-target protein n=1 Tax=Camelus dromedarius TaxID=9838 RepID=A0A5N4E510_CAMDR|nr:CAVP-target protein [Camelus dromedarius]